MHDNNFFREDVDFPSGATTRKLPPNKTLYVGKFTNDPEVEPAVITGLKTMLAVFEHYNPNVEVIFKGADGNDSPEKIEYKSLGDFTLRGLMKKSSTLQQINTREDFLTDMNRALRSNAQLRTILADDSLRRQLLAIIDQMIEMLPE